MARRIWTVKFNEPSPGWRRARIRLPDEARRDRWPLSTRIMFRRFMRRRGWIWLGSKVRRKMRNSSSWSQHSWPGQAHDFAPPYNHPRTGRKLTRAQRQRRGDIAVRIARLRWPRRFLFIWEQRGSVSLHRNGNPIHIHAERRPKRTGTPPR